MKRKGIVIVAVCLILVGLLSVNGTLANTVNRIFRIINGNDQPEQNEQMLQVAEGYLESGETVFFAVGLAHLLAEDGLVNALREAGYSVEVVSYS